ARARPHRGRYGPCQPDRGGGFRVIARGSQCMSPSSNWQSLHKILCIRLDNLGDVIMTTPAIRALKHSVSGRHITLLASRSGAKLAPFLPDVDAVIAYDAPWVKNNSDDP